LEEEEDVSAARRAYDELIALAPDHHGARLRLGALATSEEALTEAEIHFRHAAKLAPKDGASACRLGEVLLRLDRLDDAERSFRKAIREEPTYAAAYRGLAETLGEKGDFDAAVRFAQTAATLNPQSVDVLITVGRLQLAERMFGDTEATFRQVLRLGPSVPEAHRGLFYLYAEQKKSADAKKQIRLLARTAEDLSWWPIRLTVGFDTNGGAVAALAEEQEAVQAFVADRSKTRGAAAAELSPLLKSLRAGQNETSWAVKRWEKCLDFLDSFPTCRARPISFSVWLQVWGHPDLQGALQRSEKIVVVGSGSGEACLFAAAMGLACAGYDYRCELVTEASRLLAKLPRVEQHCSDVGAVNYADASVVLVLAHDATIRRRALQAAAATLRAGTHVVAVSPLHNGAQPGGASSAYRWKVLPGVTTSSRWDRSIDFTVWEAVGKPAKKRSGGREKRREL
jgi:tetratricopeptide (TPR) repeat protein